jgi:hypothetical protein
MFDHFYVIEQLQKQREKDLRKLVAETRRINKKPFLCSVPILKQSKHCGCL